MTKNIHKSLCEHKTKHYPRIKITELPRLLFDIDNSNSEPLTKYGFYVMCYTFIRTTELRGMRWGELQLSHVQGNKTVRVYNEANLLPACIRMMNEWADIVDEIKQGNFDSYTNQTPNMLQYQPKITHHKRTTMAYSKDYLTNDT